MQLRKRTSDTAKVVQVTAQLLCYVSRSTCKKARLRRRHRPSELRVVHRCRRCRKICHHVGTAAAAHLGEDEFLVANLKPVKVLAVGNRSPPSKLQDRSCCMGTGCEQHLVAEHLLESFIRRRLRCPQQTALRRDDLTNCSTPP